MSTASTIIKIGPADRGRTMTLEEFLDAEEQPGYLYELGRGVLEVSEVPIDVHGEIIYILEKHLVFHDQTNPGLIHWIGHGSEVRLRIPELISDRHPDLAIIFRGTPKDAGNRRRPKLVVEVDSTGRKARERDYVTKRAEYLILGLIEYWIVDRFDLSVTVLSRTEADAWAERVFRDDESIVSGLLPGFALRVSELWAGIDDDPEPDES